MTLAQRDERQTEIVEELATLSGYQRLSTAQREQETALKEELAALVAADTADRMARARALDSVAGGRGGALGVENGTAYPQQPHARPAGLRDQALRAIDNVRAADHARHRVATLLDHARGAELDMLARWTLATADPHYERAVGKLFRDPENGHREFTGEELAAYQQAKTVQRAMSLTDSAGGFLVPFTLDPNIMLTNTGSVNPMRQISRIATTATDSWSGVTSAGVTASWDAEGTEVSDDSPAFTQPTIPVHKGAAFIAASIEVAADSGIAAEVGALFTDAKDQLEATAYTLGSGSGQPTGIVTALTGTASEVATSTADTYALADVYKLQNAVPARWRPRSRWMMALDIINLTRRFAEGSTNAQTALVQDMGEGVPSRMLGWSLHENSNMDAIVNAAQTNFIALAGDFGQYCIVDRVGATVEYIPHLFGANGRPVGRRGWYMHWRSGGDVLIDDAFRMLNA
jgi:HK97 family phage major capsid protein